MAYPFLPVNPCCTDVVLNTPCGCSSTITNSGCNNNNPCSTHLTASSTIVYDGPILPCIVAEPCDTLNVILQKIDEIICNLQTQINYLTNQVTNINNQIITINGDIINIYNTLGECCGATTTTTSTTIAAPCESFSLDNTGVDPVAIIITDCITGEQEAIVLLPGETNICVETDSPLTVPGTVIVTPNGPCGPTTTTTTTFVPTTTTTTTAYPCECLTFTNTSSSGVDIAISYIDCLGDSIDDFISADATLQFCGSEGYSANPVVTITIGANCIDGACPVEPSTTTTTTTVACDCYNTEITITSEALAITDDTQITVLYEDCFTNPYINVYNKPGVYGIGCVNYLIGITALGQIDGIESAIYVPITVGSACCDVTTTSTSSTTAAPTTTTTSSSTSTTTSTSSSTTTTTTTVPSISPSSAEWQASIGGNGCASGDYPATIPNIPAPINFTTMFFPVISWSDIEYIEIVTVTPVAGFTVEYDGATLAPGDKLYPTSDFSWADTMSITRDSFTCTNTFEQWTVKIKLYAYTELTNTSTFNIGFVQTLCPDCITTTTTTTI